MSSASTSGSPAEFYVVERHPDLVLPCEDAFQFGHSLVSVFYLPLLELVKLLHGLEYLASLEGEEVDNRPSEGVASLDQEWPVVPVEDLQTPVLSGILPECVCEGPLCDVVENHGPFVRLLGWVMLELTFVHQVVEWDGIPSHAEDTSSTF